MIELTWRKEPPDKPGWWWVKRYDLEPYVTQVSSHVGRLYANPPNLEMNLPLEDSYFKDALWAGPIEPPSED